MKTVVISLGGSLIVPDTIDIVYLRKFRSFVRKLSRIYRIVIITGGGSTARCYIRALQGIHSRHDHRSWIGIKTTKLNATLLLSYFDRLEPLPDSLSDVRNVLQKHNLVVCGALGFQPDMTSDGNAAQIAAYLRADFFVNLTNVDGLFTKDPRKYADAQLIPSLSFSDFFTMTRRIRFVPGQHFVLDGAAARIILEHKIPTVILHGKHLSDLRRCLEGKPFKGTFIHA